MSLLPSIRLAGLRTIKSTSGGSGIKNSKSLRSLLGPQSQLLKISSANMHGKSIRDEWLDRPKPWPYEEKGYRSWRSWYDFTLKRFDENTKVIFIDGPPAVGKDELGKALAEDFGMKYFPPASMDLYYINGYGYDLRQLDDQLPKSVRSYDEKTFIKNPTDKYKRLIQMEICQLSNVYSQYCDALCHLFNTGQGVILTKNPYSHLAYIEGHYAAGYLVRNELKAYNTIMEAVMKHLLKPHLIIYLDCPIPALQEKYKRRGHGEEKTLTPEFLKAMENSYKTKYLHEMEVNCEVLVYDWTEPGDLEVVVEDIERINFEEIREPRHPKLKDWVFHYDAEASEERWKFTERKCVIMQDFNTPIFDCPTLFGNYDDYGVLWDVYGKAPGMQYNYGYNPDMGDNVLWKTKDYFPFVFRKDKGI